jgi:hypothetical protein
MPKNVSHISDSALGKFQTIFEKWIYLCPLLYSAPWVKYCSENDSVMNYATRCFSFKKIYFNNKIKVLAGRQNKKIESVLNMCSE